MLVCVLLFVTFSISVSAENLSVGDIVDSFDVPVKDDLYSDEVEVSSGSPIMFKALSPDNVDEQLTSGSISLRYEYWNDNQIIYSYENEYTSDRIYGITSSYIKNQSKDLLTPTLYDWIYISDVSNGLFSRGDSVDIVLEGIYNEISIYDVSSNLIYKSTINQEKIVPTLVRVKYTNGEYEDFTADDFSLEVGSVTLNDSYYIKLKSSEFSYDVESIAVGLYYDITSYDHNDEILDSYYIMCRFGFDYCKLDVQFLNDENGLLSGIIGWVKNIYNTLVGLPSKIGDFIIDGLKSLFIPTQDFLETTQRRFDYILNLRLGAIWQTCTFATDFIKAFTYSGDTTSITFPEVTVNLANTPFTFGGWTVNVIPDGFSGIISTLKIITSIGATFLFVNGLMKRYEKIAGENQ